MMDTAFQPPLLSTLNLEHPAFISAAAFREACYSLVERSKAVDVPGWRLKLLEEHGSSYLTISRTLAEQLSLSTQSHSGSDVEAQVDGNSDEEEDDAAAIHHHEGLSPSIEYSIVLSPVYRVPVLYFFLHNFPGHSLPDVEIAHGLLVPDHLRATISEMSVMGAISMSVGWAKAVATPQADRVRQNHPITDFPAYFIHPCNTAEAMREIIGERRISPSEYLQIWIGLVGSCVSLSLPSQLALPIKQEFD